MKKLTLTILALSIVAFSFGQEKKAQKVEVDKSKLQLNAGFGLSYVTYYAAFPIYLGADYWINQDITVGLEGIFRIGHHISVGGVVNGNYHFNKLLDLPDNLDLYAGLSAGPYFVFGATPPLRIDIHFQAGGRYKLTDKLWLNGELGGGSLTGAKFGITYKL